MRCADYGRFALETMTPADATKCLCGPAFDAMERPASPPKLQPHPDPPGGPDPDAADPSEPLLPDEAPAPA